MNPLLHLMKKSDKIAYSTATLESLLRLTNSMSTQLDNQPFDDTYFQQNLPQVYRSILRSFRKISTSFAVFNVSYAVLFTLELSSFLFFLPLLSQSTFLAISLSCIFLTVFSYIVLLFYFLAKKPEQFVHLKDQFLSSAQKLIGLPSGDAEYHLSIAAALGKLALYLDDFEGKLYRIPSIFNSFRKNLEGFSAFCHWQDVFRFKQILLHAAIEEHLLQIRATPTDLEVHASLANTYIALSKLFVEPKRASLTRIYHKRKESFDDNFRTASSLAIEEFQILNHYAPNDPWVHEQLAAGYRDLGMPENEIKEVEILLKLRPQDRELLLRLGMLYFEQGSNAKGLRIYEELKQANYMKAKDLMEAYGKPQDTRLSCEIL
jgi:hypothetical protein